MNISATKSRRIFAVADVHADHIENLHAVKSWSRCKYLNDALVVAGDVTDSLKLLQDVLGFLKRTFNEVFFVPGNHELWVRGEGGDNTGAKTSLQKFSQVISTCDGLGVKTTPEKFSIGDDRNGNTYVWVVPLFSWYTTPDDDSFDSLYTPHLSVHEDLEKVQLLWMDAHHCIWPPMYDTHPSEYFCDMNSAALQSYPGIGHDSQPIISFSHFMPRADLIIPDSHETAAHNLERLGRGFRSSEPPSNQGSPDFFNFSRFAGCKRLDHQIRCLGSTVHFYGHQHRNRDRIIEGVHYVSHSLGYKRERDAGLVWGVDNLLSPKQIWPPLR